MNLIPNESILLSNEGNAVILTNFRIRASAGTGNDGTLTSIMLEKVSSLQLNSQSYPIFLVIGALMLLAGIGIGFANSGGKSGAGGISLVVAGILIGVIYFYTRRHTCIIASDGGSRIVFSTTNMKRDALVNFIDKVEEAKYNRVKALTII